MNNEPISSLMQSPVRTIRMDDTVQAVETFLNNQGLSWVLVVNEEGEAVGGLSADELIRFQISNPDATTTPVWRLCTYQPVCVSPDATVSAVAHLMVDRKIHHVVITDSNGINGVVSSLDFLKLLF
jgi:signal-transduction protein with cAMP-binding, CBS, and nucleotidyltransferase domain